MKLIDRLVAIDTETTGLEADKHEILEVCAIRKLRPNEAPFVDAHPVQDNNDVPVWSMEQFARNKQVAVYWRRLTPKRLETAAQEALDVNGYSEEKWAGSLPWEAHIDSFTEFVGRPVFLGQNVPFDVGFIENVYAELKVEQPCRFRTVDTMTLAWEHLVPWGLRSLSFRSICTAVGVDNAKAHTAFSDTAAVYEVYHTLCLAPWYKRVWWGVQIWWRNRKRDREKAAEKSATATKEAKAV
jgi:DNA polymerase III epsilon subunit-like protein